jgi:hypothetical protein
MKEVNVKVAVEEATRFLKRAAEWEATAVRHSFGPLSRDSYVVHGGRESGALRRASLDLTRALSKMRNG